MEEMVLWRFLEAAESIFLKMFLVKINRWIKSSKFAVDVSLESTENMFECVL
jgi:hypothetical protein